MNRRIALLKDKKVWCIRGATNYKTDVGSGATIDNLADAAMTVEGWWRAPTSAANQHLCSKGDQATVGWFLSVNATNGLLTARIFCAGGTNANSITTGSIADNYWHQIAFTFDDAGDRKPYIYIDNVLVAQTQTAGVGAIVADAANNGAIGRTSLSNTGAHGWVRWSNVVRSGFIPRNKPPAIDANTVAQWNCNEGAGTALADSSGKANTGTIANGTWAKE